MFECVCREKKSQIQAQWALDKNKGDQGPGSLKGVQQTEFKCELLGTQAKPWLHLNNQHLYQTFTLKH